MISFSGDESVQVTFARQMAHVNENGHTASKSYE